MSFKLIHSMSNQNDLPAYLQEIHDMLNCAFPEGIPDNAYMPIMAIFHPVMSFRTLAKVLSEYTDKPYIEVFNDASGFGLDPMPDSRMVDEMRQKLVTCGYEDSLKKQP